MIKALLAEGVDTVFGYPGGAILPVYDSLYDYTDKITHILTRHEQAPSTPPRAMPASADARASSSSPRAREQPTSSRV